jgi:tRNA uridine 5-carboxymethylaminomethyl modification enzyme
MINEERYARFLEKKRLIEEERNRLEGIIIKTEPHVLELMEEAESVMKEAQRASDLLKRPEIKYSLLEKIVPADKELPADVKEQVEIQTKYEGYIKKSMQQVERMKRMEDKKIPDIINYDDVSGLATEAREKLKKVRPLSVGQASRISGVNPADVSILLVFIEQGGHTKAANQ